MMDNDTVIKVEGLCKKFCINQRKSMFYGGVDVLRNMVGLPAPRDTLRNHEIWALKDINFELKRGETLGIIGANGAGKSTLLRVLSGIYPPDAGRVSIRGTVGALIAAGAGFHPDMTGRENIYLNGAIIGLKKKEIDAKLEEIIEFAELGEFIDTPVRFYSSGMYVRLGFSIAVNIRPRILITDEVLSVGDLSFQNKCFRKLKELRDSVDAVVFVSHNLDHIRNICTDLIFLDSGKIEYHGDVEEGIIRYQAHAHDLKKKSAEAELKGQHIGSSSFDSSDVELEEIKIGNQQGEFNGEIATGDDLVIKVAFRVQGEGVSPQFTVSLLDENNSVVVWQIDQDNKSCFDKLGLGNYQLTVSYKQLPLVPGVYKLGLAIRDSETCEILSRHNKVLPFLVRGDKFSRGIIHCDSLWKLNKHPGPEKSRNDSIR